MKTLPPSLPLGRGATGHIIRSVPKNPLVAGPETHGHQWGRWPGAPVTERTESLGSFSTTSTTPVEIPATGVTHQKLWPETDLLIEVHLSLFTSAAMNFNIGINDEDDINHLVLETSHNLAQHHGHSGVRRITVADHDTHVWNVTVNRVGGAANAIQTDANDYCYITVKEVPGL